MVNTLIPNLGNPKSNPFRTSEHKEKKMTQMIGSVNSYAARIIARKVEDARRKLAEMIPHDPDIKQINQNAIIAGERLRLKPWDEIVEMFTNRPWGLQPACLFEVPKEHASRVKAYQQAKKEFARKMEGLNKFAEDQMDLVALDKLPKDKAVENVTKYIERMFNTSNERKIVKVGE